ncbi:MAG: cyclic pyranopterin monophosphate synthase MoaC [Dehalococcoidia bacterium]|nr:cyclic pyranopterin monophosphate synthase MoaC [Dehalococcoidia bacterium]
MPELSHLDESGALRMVDVSEKPETLRKARASGRVHTNAETLHLVTSGAAPKGDVLTAARIAGIMAAKKTSDLIPLCHPLNVSAIDVQLTPRVEDSTIEIEASVTTTGPTGVEMEAMTAVSVAALTVYDMLKAADRAIRISDIHLLAKSGGRSGDYVAPGHLPVVEDSPEGSALPVPSVIPLPSAEAAQASTAGAPDDSEAADDLSGPAEPDIEPTVPPEDERPPEFAGAAMPGDGRSGVGDDRLVTLQLQGGLEVENITEALRRVYERDPGLAAYDLAAVDEGAPLRPADVEAAAPIIAGYSPKVLEALYDREAEVSAALSRIPPHASLAGPPGSIQWDALADLLRAAIGREIGLARATKILHKKRPSLIPVIDEAILGYTMRVAGPLPAEPVDCALKVMGTLKQDLDANAEVLGGAAGEVEDVELSPLRVLDLAIRSLA